jgi:uncharacterized protein (DUF2267 family)
MDYERLVNRVQHRTGLERPELAGMAVSATMSALARALEPEDLSLVASILPAPLSDQLRGAASSNGTVPFLADVAEHEQVGLGFAKEHAQVVCETLAGELEPGALQRLKQAVPPEVAKLLVPYEAPPEARPKPAQPREPHRNLAEGRPGSAEPLAEGRPPAGHTDSPARTTDPDAKTKLSSAEDVRHGDTLAEGRPGSKHPVSESGQ